MYSRLVSEHNLEFAVLYTDITAGKDMTANYIVRLPYEIYYFSRNLEHVLHDNSENLDDDQKEALAFETADYYSNHPDQFLESLYDEYFHASGTYGGDMEI